MTRKAVLDAFDNFMGEVVKSVTLSIHENLTEDPPIGTPIDQHFATSNWIPAIGRPRSGAPVGFRVPDEGRSRGTVGPGVTFGPQLSGRDEVKRYRFSRRSARPTSIVNNVDYIGGLNLGSSRQSPSGFVQIAIRRGMDKASKITRGLGR